jgi:hypothetical protein
MILPPILKIIQVEGKKAIAALGIVGGIVLGLMVLFELLTWIAGLVQKNSLEGRMEAAAKATEEAK